MVSQRRQPRTRPDRTPTRRLPQNSAAEASVLGGILLRNEVLAQVAPLLEPKMFVDLRNQLVYAAMLTLHTQGSPIDEVTVGAAVAQAGYREQVPLSYLSALTLRVPTTDHVIHYARLVRDTHGIRTLMLALSEQLERGYEHPGDLSEYQAQALAAVHQTIGDTTTGGPQPIRKVLARFGRVMDRRYEAEDGLTGVPTGLTVFDREFGGLQPPDLIILAGRPAMGKTSLGLGIAHHAASHGVPVVIFSLEMTGVQLIERYICTHARITPTALRRGEVTSEQLDAMTEAIGLLSTLPIEIDDSRALSDHQVSARAQRFAHAHSEAPQGLVVIDYLQLMRSPRQNGTREQEISAISASLKGLAKTLGWPILALAQLNRGLESRANKRPVMSDLRESGSLEQDADSVCMLYRDVVYNDQADPQHAELILAKNRHGGPTTIELRFIGEHTRFEDWRPEKR